MNMFIVGLLIFSMASCNLWIAHSQKTFDVLQFGAKGDGSTDDSQAFLDAWKEFCGANSGTPTLVVPVGKTYYLHPSLFEGPCKSPNLHIQILGTLLAPTRDAWNEKWSNRWLHFVNVAGMTFDGSGVVNGQGEAWWGKDQGIKGGVRGPPTALQFDKCNGLQISGLNHINGPGSHIAVVDGQDITISIIHINSPEKSHNTDGIDVTRTIRVNIHDMLIESGDDCVAIKGGTKFINVTGVTCGPGHGISVGSLGKGGGEEFVEQISVRNCTFNGATSAVKIKTWPGGRGYAKDIIFDHIIVNQTDYPVLIDQHYLRTPEKDNAVKVSNITFSNIHGTCTGENAVYLDCAHIFCDNITLKKIKITSIDRKKPAAAFCNHAHGIATDVTSPTVSCLHP